MSFQIYPKIAESIETVSEKLCWRLKFQEPTSDLLTSCLKTGWHDRHCVHYESTFEESLNEYDCGGKCLERIDRWHPRTMFEMVLLIALSDASDGQQLRAEIMKRRTGEAWSLPDVDAASILSCTYGKLVFREQFDALLALCTGTDDPVHAHFLYMILVNARGTSDQNPVTDLRARIPSDRLPLLDYVLRSCRLDRKYFSLPTLFRTCNEAYDLIRAAEIKPYRSAYLRMTVA